jgi:hypothetical protein
MSIVAHNAVNNAIRGGIFALPVILGCAAAHAEDLNAGAVMNLMTSEQRSAYLQGIVEGMAFSRFQQDGNEAGMQCMYKFYYDGNAGKLAILDAFDRFPDHTPGALMAALLEKECPS